MQESWESEQYRQQQMGARRYRDITKKRWERIDKFVELLRAGKPHTLADVARALGDPLCTCGHAHSDHDERGCQWGDKRERCACRMYDQTPDDKAE